ncbi:hypothetical protein [Actinoplanes sp. NPDC048796]|uniref:hypothetical protein n=1 Tax=unclassified Actinoplanes TaxID=2626549 RepID=UPI0033E73D07
MEPVPVTRGVRRTVRMAVALVIGQALLCALIGWLTLGRSGSESGGSGAAVDQAAAPPPRPSAAAPAPAVPAPEPPVAAPRSPEAPVSKTRRPTRKATTTVTAAAPEATKPPPVTSKPAVPSVTPSSELIMLPPEPPESPVASPSSSPTPGDRPRPDGEQFQRDVTVGDRCWPEGAFGRTRDGELVRCLRARYDPPRWKIV